MKLNLDSRLKCSAIAKKHSLLIMVVGTEIRCSGHSHDHTATQGKWVILPLVRYSQRVSLNKWSPHARGLDIGDAMD